MIEIVKLIGLYLIGFIVINIGLWIQLRLKVLGDFSVKTTKVIMLIVNILFVILIFWYHVFKRC